MINECPDDFNTQPIQINLDQLASKINESHHLVGQHAKQAVAHGIAAGEALLQAKAICPPGQWMGWLAARCHSISTRTARQYTWLATHKEQVAEAASIREAIKLAKTQQPDQIGNALPISLPQPDHYEDGNNCAASKPKVLCSRCTRIGETANCPMCKELRKTGAKKPDKKADDDQPKDSFGNELPKRCRPAYSDPWIPEALEFMHDLLKSFLNKRLATGFDKRAKHYPFMNGKDIIDGLGQIGNTLDQVIDHIEANKPAGVCPKCQGDGCPKCKQSGLLPKEIYKEVKGHVKEVS